MATSSVEIVNSALAKIGAPSISSLNDDSEPARRANRIYESARDELLRSHPWNFAIKRVSLSPNATGPEYEFTYAYDIPSDCLRVLNTDLDDVLDGRLWYKEGNTIIADSSTLKIKYIYKNENVEMYDSSFNETLSYRIARDLASSLNRDKNLSLTMNQYYEQSLAMARSFNGQEGSTRVVKADLWLNQRY